MGLRMRWIFVVVRVMMCSLQYWVMMHTAAQIEYQKISVDIFDIVGADVTGGARYEPRCKSGGKLRFFLWVTLGQVALLFDSACTRCMVNDVVVGGPTSRF
jgi:hypothetical protein